MPILTLKLSANANLKNANALARDLTALSADVLHKRADVTSVVFQRVAANDWWVGGDVSPQVLMQLDIRITQGTNTEAEKASFVAQAFALLPKHLVDGQTLHATSYISVQELVASDWGYGGRSVVPTSTLAASSPKVPPDSMLVCPLTVLIPTVVVPAA